MKRIKRYLAITSFLFCTVFNIAYSQQNKFVKMRLDSLSKTKRTFSIQDIRPTLSSKESIQLIESMGDYYLYSGDILLDKRSKEHKKIISILKHLSKGKVVRSVTKTDIPYWPNAEVPYWLENDLTQSEVNLIQQAMGIIEGYCNVRFIQKNENDDYVYSIKKITDPDICGQSTLGYTENANYDFVCSDIGTILHEISHGLGFCHEHQRYNRDDYVTINWNNIKDDYKNQFDKMPWSIALPYTNYDYGSIMHYDAYAFSKNGQKTIDAKSNSIGQRTGLSTGDIEGLKLMYGYINQGSSAIRYLCGNVNHDGRSDIIQLKSNLFFKLGMVTYLSTGVAFNNNWSTGDIGQVANSLAWLTGDVNGDGQTDIIQPYNNQNKLGLRTYLSDGNGYSCNWGADNMGQGPWALAWLTGDVNGDGKTDIIQPWKNTDKLGLLTYLSDGNGYTCNWGTEDIGQGPGALAWLTGDINGDGKTDIIQPWKNHDKLGLLTYVSDGNGYSCNWGTDDMGQGPWALAWLTGDVNGDGKTDIIQPFNSRGRLGILTYLSNGNGYSCNWGTDDMGQGPGALAWLTGDVNGDGRTDIIQPFNSRGKLGLLTYLSDGNGYSASWGSEDMGLDADALAWFVKDVNLDGYDDLIRVSDASGHIGLKIFFSNGTGY